MSDAFWEVPVEVEAEAGPPAELAPKEFTEVELYRIPDKINATWIGAQLSKKEWAEIKSTQHSTRLNPHLIASMCDDAEKGLSKRSIMARAGYSVATWSNWEKRAARGEQPYALWYQCMMASISSVEEELIDTVRLQASGDWKAAKWLLEQLNKDEYSPAPKNQTVNISGDVHNETNSTTSVNYMDDEKAVQVAQLLQRFGVVPQIENVVEGEVVDDAPDDSDSGGAQDSS